MYFFASSSLYFYVHVPIETHGINQYIQPYSFIHVITHPIGTPTHSIHSSNLIAMLFTVISNIFSSIKKKVHKYRGAV